MNRVIIWSPVAVVDLENILTYLSEQWSDSIASQYVETIDKLLIYISINPGLFPLIHRNKKVRKCVISKHNTLYYRANNSKIEILRIFDSRQDAAKLKL